MSLVGPSSPRATEPNTDTVKPLCCLTIATMASRCRSTREPRAVAASAIPTVYERMRRRHGGRRARARGTTKVDADFNLLAAATTSPVSLCSAPHSTTTGRTVND